MVTRTVAAAAPAAPRATTGARTVDCSIEFGGMISRSGRCQFTPVLGDGSFEVTHIGSGQGARVVVTSRNVGEAFSDNPSGWSSWGQVTRSGACGSGGSATDFREVCAY